MPKVVEAAVLVVPPAAPARRVQAQQVRAAAKAERARRPDEVETLSAVERLPEQSVEARQRARSAVEHRLQTLQAILRLPRRGRRLLKHKRRLLHPLEIPQPPAA